MLRRILVFLLFVVLALISVILIRTFIFPSRQLQLAAKASPMVSPEALDHFVNSISFKTISYADSSKFDSAEFIGFRNYLAETYPLVHAHLNREIVKGYSLLFTWQGKRKDINPIVLMAHQDVVPIEEGTEKIWTTDPFKGIVKDEFVWGRGTADDKINLIAIMETVEKLLKNGFQPERTIYLAFGHDEETYGSGAIEIAALLVSRKVKADLVLDEGGLITREKIPGMEGKSVALLGTSEKGAMSLELMVEQPGGHSAMPAEETAIDILARAVSKLRGEKFEARFSLSTEGFIEYLGPEMPFVQKMAFANLWLFRPTVNNLYEKSREGNAMIRTTLAPTIFQSGIKDNVVPTLATATVNLRLLPGDSSSAIVQEVVRRINDDRVKVNIKSFVREATSVTLPESFGFRKVDSAIHLAHADILSAPFMMIAATDSRYFQGVSHNIIKFSPMVDPIGFHGIDERVSLESYQIALMFFEQLISGS